MSDYEIYDLTIHRIKKYFANKDVDELFLHGGCYWLANYLHERLSLSFIMFNKEKEHCAIEFHNELYDITGKINSKQYRLATERNLEYMKKHYIPTFDVKNVEHYLKADDSLNK